MSHEVFEKWALENTPLSLEDLRGAGGHRMVAQTAWEAWNAREPELAALRQQLAEAQALLREAYGYTTAATDLLPERIKAAIAQEPRHD